MPRMRFNQAERELIESSAGQLVQWQNVTQWHTVQLSNPAAVVKDDGRHYVMAVTIERKGTVSAGESIRVTPGHIREVPHVHTPACKTGGCPPLPPYCGSCYDHHWPQNPHSRVF